MNSKKVTFDWNQVRAFVATAEEGSLSGAARVLGLTQPTLGRQVSALEAQLNVVLFERVGRSLVLTPSGKELLNHSLVMNEAASRISLAAVGQSQSIEGLVRITATDLMSAYFLPSALKQLQEVAPLVEIEIVATPEISDLQLREADIAIRHIRPVQNELTARLVRKASAHFYASKTYIEEHGRPKSFADMSNHSFIGGGNNEGLIETLQQMGIPLTLANIRVSSKSGTVAWQLAQNGLGIILMADEVAKGAHGMERLLQGMEPKPFPIWLVSHRELHTNSRIRTVFDLLAEFLSNKRV